MNVPMPTNKSTKRALIVDDDTLVGAFLRASLEALGYEVVDQAADAEQAVSAYQKHSPDLVLMDIRLDGDVDGIDLSTRLLSQRRCPIVVISAHTSPTLDKRAAEAGVFGYLVKPLTREALAAQIAVATRRFREAETLREEKDTLAQTLESRKLIERAKGILMKRLNLDEPAAHKRLQAESQKRRINITELAKKVIESESLLGGG